MKFGDKLYNLRRQSGLSQEELGEKLNVTRQTISKWELGHSKPDTDKLIEISKLLDVDFNRLVDDNKKIETSKKVSNSNYDDLNPRKWLLVVLIIIAIIIVIILANKFITVRKEKAENNNGIYGIFNGFSNLIEQQMKEGPEDFNYSFEFYSGTKSGLFVSNLIDEIITNNKTNNDRLITLIFNNLNTNEPNTIKDAKNNIDSLNEYEVSLDYDENGYVNKVTIEESNKVDQFEVSRFNSGFEFYSGTNFGSSIKMLLEKVIANNKTNSEHIIKVLYGDVDTNNENEIRTLKNSFDEWTNYEVILDYDKNKFISKITIKN